MSSNVYLFNTGSPSLKIIINNGGEFHIYGTSETLNWFPLPVTPALCFSGSFPEKNVFGFGENRCDITPSTSGKSLRASITIPQQGVSPDRQLQIYLFIAAADAVDWLLLSEGKLVAGSLPSLTRAVS